MVPHGVQDFFFGYDPVPVLHEQGDDIEHLRLDGRSTPLTRNRT